MRVCLVPSDAWGVGCYRLLFPGRELAAAGHDVFVHSDTERQAEVNDVARLRGRNPGIASSLGFKPGGGGELEESFDADVYVFQNRFERFAPSAIRLLRGLGKTVVGETDDWFGGLPAGSPGLEMLEAHPEQVSLRSFREGMAFASRLTVSTVGLAERYGNLNGDVRVLPNLLDWSMWDGVRLQYETDRPRVRVGWMGWLRGREADLDVLRPWFGGWLREHPNVDFVSVGEPRRPGKFHVSVHDFLGVPRRQRRTVPGRPFAELASIVATMDVGLVPLARSDFNECKSHLKGLEYAACGIPCIASATQEYCRFVNPFGFDGFVATNPDGWRFALDTLVNDHDTRRAMGAAARAKAAEMTIQKHWKLWEAVYERAPAVPVPSAA